MCQGACKWCAFLCVFVRFLTDSDFSYGTLYSVLCTVYSVLYTEYSLYSTRYCLVLCGPEDDMMTVIFLGSAGFALTRQPGETHPPEDGNNIIVWLVESHIHILDSGPRTEYKKNTLD